MCTGLEIAAIAGAALSAIGTGVQTVSSRQQQKKQIDANNRVVENYLAKNKKLSEQSRQIFDSRLQQENKDTTPAQDAQPASDNRAAAANDLIDATRVVAPLRGSAPNVVKEAAQQEADKVDQTGRDRAKALADVKAFGDLLFGKQLDTHSAARDVGMLGNFASADAAMVPQQAQLAQLQAASGGNPLGALGAGLNAAGGLTTTAAGSGMFSKAAPKAIPASSIYNPMYARSLGL